MTAEFELFIRFGAALAIGFLIGLQREFAYGGDGEIAAGERTFALISLGGCLAAMISDMLGSPWVLVGVIFIVGLYTAIGHFVEAWGKARVGLTTEAAVIVAVLLGALCYWNYLTLAIAIGITTTVILSIKLQTDRFVRTLTRKEVYAALQLAVISAIVLPILPREHIWDMPPFDVINPFNIWMMVVFISGINFLGYVLVKVVGSEQGIGLAGFLGGLVSSTAVTLSFSERSQRQTDLSKPFALAITVAWTVMFSRVLVEVGVLNPELLKVVWIPIAAAGAAGLVYCVFLYFSQHTSEKSDMEFSNPMDLGAAVKFGLMYGVILLVSRAAHFYFEETGLFISSLLSGLTDVDAITLSMSELSSTGAVPLGTASQAIVLAAMANTVAKGAIVLMSGSPGLRKAIWPGILLVLVVGISVAFII